MKKAILLALFAASSLTAQRGLIAPRVGFIRDSADTLIPVHGVRANFILGQPVIKGVYASAFSGTFGLAKTNEAVLVFDSDANPITQLRSPGDTALFAFHQDGRPALVYVPKARELFRWEGKSLAQVEWTTGGFTGEPVTLAQLSARTLATVEQREESLWMVHRDLRDGLVRFETMLPGVSAPALLIADGTLMYRSTEGLAIRWTGGTEQHLRLATAPTGLEQIGEGWIRVSTRRPDSFAIRLSVVEAKTYRLPAGGRR